MPIDYAPIDALLDAGEAALAYDRIESALDEAPDDLRLRERKVRALVGLGADRDAEDLIATLDGEGFATPETLGFAASLRKRRALDEPDPNAIRNGLEEALALYRRAAERHAREDGWFHINIAALEAVLGRDELARQAAESALARVEDAGSDGWTLGTRATAYVVLGDEERAVDAYAQLAAHARESKTWEMVASARRTARLLLSPPADLQAVTMHPDRIQALLRTPPVVMAVGHMVDEPNRASARFPSSLVPRLRDAVDAFVTAHRPSFGFGSLACGTDIVFHDVMAEHDVPRVAVLPFPEEAFVPQSVARVHGNDWVGRFDALWNTSADRHTTALGGLGADELCHEFASDMLTGLGLLKADALDTNVIGFALWDGESGDGPGGTSWTVERWRAHPSIEIARIRPHDLEGGRIDTEPLATLDAPAGERTDADDATIAAFLFADAAGFSQLGERGTRAFATTILGALADVAREYDECVLEANTWGDALFFALTDVGPAGRLALDLCDAVERSRAASSDLPPSLGLRIALHTAPVRIYFDPIRRQQGVSGAEISTAARIEPITPAGHVFASEAFAALSRARCATGYRCRFVGTKTLAKQHGPHPLYVVERVPPEAT